VSLGLDLSILTSVEIPRKTKSAGLAFLVSLILPGIGQVYCGKRSRGLWTLGWWLLSVALVFAGYRQLDLWPTEMTGTAVLAVVPIYIFAFLDSYYTAREINAGTDAQVDVSNPRVAASLNLLTNGFGYWYLGERKKGWLVFIGCGILLRSLAQYTGASALFLFLRCLLSVDGYLTARKQIQAATAGAPEAQGPLRKTRLPALVPIATGMLLLTTIAAMMGMNHAAREFNEIDQTDAVVYQGTDSKLYSNAKYGIRMLAPATWQLDASNQKIVIAATKGKGCRAALVQEGATPLYSLNAVRRKLTRNVLDKNSNYREVVQRSGQLGNLPGEEVEFVENRVDGDIVQRYLVARRGLAVYTLVTTMAASRRADCESDAEWIRENITIGR
jgi:hypothetical protein